MSEFDKAEEINSLTPISSGALIARSSNLVKRGLALANTLLRRERAEIYYKSGHDKSIKGEYLKAIEDYTQAIQIDPDFAEAYSGRAFCFGKLGEYQKALQDQEVRVRLMPHDDLGYVLRGNCHIDLGNYQEAIRDYTQAIALTPEKYPGKNIRPEAIKSGRYEKRGLVYSSIDKYQEAIDDYTRAIELELPRVNTSAYIARGVAYYKNDKMREAVKDFAMAMENELWLMEPSYFRGLAYEKLGMNQNALEDYTRVIELRQKQERPGFIISEEEKEYLDSAYWQRGIVYRKLDMLKDALEDFREAARLGNKIAQSYLQEKIYKRS